MSNINVSMQTLADSRQINRTGELLARSLARLSSGLRVVSPSDDPTGVGRTEKLSAQNKRVEAASTNVQNAISYLQSSDSFLGGMGSSVARMSELTMLATDTTKNPGDIANYQSEFKELQDQLRATIGGTTAEIGGTMDITKPLGSFNGNILFGPNPSGLTIAVGQAAGQTLTIPQTNLRTSALLPLMQQDSAGAYTMTVTDPAATAKLTAALQDLGDTRSTVGSIDSRLSYIAQSLTTEGQNLTSTLSRIQDVDVAEESTRLTKYNLMQKSSTAILAQANQGSRDVLQLLQG